jgi:hypothetical protein
VDGSNRNVAGPETANGGRTGPAFFSSDPSDHPASHSREKVSKKAMEKFGAGAKCQTCGKPLEYQGIGRPRKFCGEGCYAVAHNRRRQVVPAYLYNAERRTYVPNPDPRPKSKVY